MKSFTATERQKLILSLLLDKYESSLTYESRNLVHQSFALTPDKVYHRYNDNFEPQENVILFEKELEELESYGLVSLSWKNNVVTRITAVDAAIQHFYEIIGRREKKDIIKDQRKFYKSCLGRNRIIDDFANEELSRLDSGKKPSYSLKEADDIVRLLDFILSDNGETLERELSIAVLGDSKIFEKKYRNRIVKILEKYAETDDLFDLYDKREQQIAVLEKYGILTNPSSVWVRGRGRIFFQDKTEMQLSDRYPIGLSTGTISLIEYIRIEEPSLMTIENLTSFNRFREDGIFTMYLGGYHNMAKQHLISLISDAKRLELYHFGDIDPDGFLILERLRQRTGIDFKPYHMDIADLKQFERYTRHLEKNDITKAENLIKRGRYTEIMKYMLSHNEKLEQEIISMQKK